MEKNETISMGIPEFNANEGLLQSIMNVFDMISHAADSGDLDKTAWKTNFYVKLLTARILDPEDRESLREASETLLKLRLDEANEDKKKRNEKLTKSDEMEIRINVDLLILGEISSYIDRYFGLETKLGVML